MGTPTDAKEIGRRPIMVRMSPGLVARIDDEWHRRKFRSREQTIRALIHEALDASAQPPARSDAGGSPW